MIVFYWGVSRGPCAAKVHTCILYSCNPTTHNTLAHAPNNKAISKKQTKLKAKPAYEFSMGCERPPVRSRGAYMRSLFVNPTTHNTLAHAPNKKAISKKQK